MCDPVSAGIATAVGAAASLAGTFMASNAAKQNQQAIANQNRQMQVAQNEGFTQRLNAGLQQTAAQSAAAQQTLADRGTAANQMRGMQTDALQNYREAVNAQNQTAESLRQTGDAAAQQLLQQTSAQNLADAQTRRQQETADLMNQNMPGGPQESDPGTGAVARDPVTGGAMARRAAEAATNIRSYGAKIGQLESYAGPGTEVGLAIAANKGGILPAQAAEQLLRSGSSTRLLPTKLAYRGATDLGAAQDTLLQSRGQGALDAAGLSYGNAVDIANLGQSNANTIAGNTARQAQANADYKKSQAGIVSGLGNLGLYGAGYFGGDSLKSGLSDIFHSGEVFNAAGNDTIPNPNYLFGLGRL